MSFSKREKLNVFALVTNVDIQTLLTGDLQLLHHLLCSSKSDSPDLLLSGRYCRLPVWPLY